MSTPLDHDLAAFLQFGRSRAWAPSTVKVYTSRVVHIARFCRIRGCRRSADVTYADLMALMQDQLERGVAKSSRVQMATTLHYIFGWMLDEGRILRNPAARVPAPDDGERDLPKSPMTEAEMSSFIASLPRHSVTDIRNIAIMEFLYGCGMRRGEVLRLNLDDVDLDRRVLTIHESKAGQSRILPVMHAAIVALRDYLAVRRSLLRGPDHGAVFLTASGKRLDEPTFGAVFRMINKLRGPDMPRIHAHLLRHSIAVHLVRKGADIHHVQAFLGHGNLNTTKIYLRMVPGQLAQSYEQYMPDIAVGL